MKYPEIHVQYGWLLAGATAEGLNEAWGDGTPLRSDEEYRKITEDYEKAWQPYEKKILKAMCDILGLSFRHNIIDVYIAPWMYAYSTPMVVGVTYSPDRFVEVLTHELLHRLLTENNETDWKKIDVARWEKVFGKHDFNVTVHIPVHAVYQAIFDDILGEPQRTKNDRELCRQWPAYDKAWQYVEKVGYQKIIEQLKKDYQKLREV